MGEPQRIAEDEPETVLHALDAVEDVDDAVELAEANEAAIQTEDPLKLYVRQIGDGRLLTPREER